MRFGPFQKAFCKIGRQNVLGVVLAVTIIVLPVSSIVFREESEGILPLLTVCFLSVALVTDVLLSKQGVSCVDKTTVLLFIFFLWFIANTTISGRGLDGIGVQKWACVLLFFLFSRQLKEHRCAILYGLLISGLFQSVVVTLQWFHVFNSFSAYFPVSGTFSNPNHAGCLIGLSCVVGLYMGRMKWLSIFTFLSLILCGSRGNILGVSIILCALICHRLLIKIGRKHGIIVVSLFAFAAIACLILFLYRLNVNSADGRILIWRVCLSGIQSHPLMGAGAGSLAADYMYLQAEWVRNHPDSGLLLLADNNHYCFNEVLHLLFEQGIIGLTLMCIVVCKSLKYTDKTILAGVLFLFISSMTLYSADIFPVFVSFWLLLAMGKSNEGTLFEISNPSYVAIVIACALFGASYINKGKEVCRFPSYETTCSEGDEYLKRAVYCEAEKKYRLAMDMVPGRVYAPYRLFKMYVENGEDAKARITGEKILSMRVKVFGDVTIRIRGEVKRWLELHELDDRYE